MRRSVRQNLRMFSGMGGALAVAIASPAAAQAQDQAAPQTAPETAKGNDSVLMQDIVVTANKRQEKLQNVGIAATAFSGSTLSQLGVVNASDLAKIAPALNVNYANPSVSSMSIRGVSQNDFADHLEPPVAAYQDEGYIGTSGAVAVPVFDLERVEVLRGPQGTLFGRNATGGLIHFISAAPTDTLSGYLQASYGRFNTWNVEGAISGPLAEGVTGRLAFTRNKSDGPFTNVVAGAGRVGDTDNWAIRGQLRFKIGDSTDLRLLGKYYKDDQAGPAFVTRTGQLNSDGLGELLGSNAIGSWPNLVTGGTITGTCAGCNIVGYKDADGNPWTVANNYPGYYKRDIFGLQAKLTHDFDGIVLTTISDYLNVKKNTRYDVDMSPENFFIYGSYQNYKQFSQELRLNGTSGALKWVAGLYYLNMRGYYTEPLDLDFGVYLGLAPCTGAACGPGDGALPVHFEPRYTLDVDSGAIFAQGEYALSSKVSVTVGARYTYDWKRFHYEFSQTQPFNPSVIFDDHRTFQNVAAKAQVDWRPVDGTLAYASYTRGHKGGNWAAPAFPPIDVAALPHKQEVLTSYEVGLKQNLFGRLATINLSAYYYDYHNYQAFSLQGLGEAIFNRDAEVYGGEAELRLAPMRGLDISANGVLMGTKVKNITLSSGRVVDRQMPNSPTFQATGLIRYGWNMFDGKMSVQASGKYMSGHYLTVLNEPINYQAGYGTLDLQVAWQTADRKFEVAAYATNVTGTLYRVWANDVSALSLADNVMGARSSYGARIRYNF